MHSNQKQPSLSTIAVGIAAGAIIIGPVTLEISAKTTPTNPAVENQPDQSPNISYSKEITTPTVHSKHSKEFTNKVIPYFKKHCVMCHGPDDEEGSLRVDKIVANLEDEYTLGHLQNIIDEITVENMPPEEEPLPDSKDTIEIINILTNIENEVKERHTAGGGRPIRRLTRTEFSNTIADLLGIRPENVNELPDDLYVGNFETNAETLYLTDLHIDLYLNKSRQVIKKFIASRHDKPGKRVLETTYSPLLKRSNFGFSRQDVGHVGELTIRTHWWVRNPADAGKIDIGPKDSNLYHTISGTKQKPQIIDFTITSSGEDISWVIKKSPTQSINQLAGLTRRATQKKIAQFNSVRITDSNLISVQEKKFQHPVILGKIEQIKQSTAQSHNFFSPFLKNGDNLPDSVAPSILKKFAILAKRGRAADPSFISLLNKVFEEGRAQGMTFWEAIEEPMAISLCSIDSILHFENRNPSKKSISGLELANRLSYMLWRSAPDLELVQLGRSDELLNPSTRAAQIKRMMNDQKFDRFMNDFSDQWLELPRQLEIAVDERIYKNFNTSLKPHMKQETIAFMSHLIRENLSILNMIDSSFMVLNEPMAKHYGIPGIRGNQFRPVKRDESASAQARGGILTHAGILMQGTSGDRTSIVERGAFIARKIIDTPPAEPPPNVSELPSTADTSKMTGAQLVQHHTNIPACANCHSKIDPLGIGLEEYDVIGLIRKSEIRPNPIFDKLGKRAKKNPKNRTINVKLDTKGKLYDGQRFQGIDQMKQVLLSKKHSLAKGYLKALFSYVNGRKAGLADETIIINILKETEADNYPARTIIEKVANSDAMLRF